MKTIEVLPQAAGFNKVINGGLHFWQKQTTLTGISSGAYPADMFKHSHSLATGVVDVTQSTDVPNNSTDYSLRYDVTTAQASIAGAEYMLLDHNIEGYNSRELYGKSFVVAFQVKSSKTGIYCVAIRNAASDRSYVSEIEISSSGVWEPKYIRVPHELVGTWESTTGVGIKISFVLASGTNYHNTKDTWISSHAIATSNQVNFLDSTANYFMLSQVMVHKGRAPIEDFVLSGENIGSELAACQRYYLDGGSTYYNLGTYLNANEVHCDVDYPAEMRLTPTITLFYGGSTGVIRSLNNGATPACSVGALYSTRGFGRIDSAGLFVSGNLYHFNFTASAEF